MNMHWCIGAMVMMLWDKSCIWTCTCVLVIMDVMCRNKHDEYWLVDAMWCNMLVVYVIIMYDAMCLCHEVMRCHDMFRWTSRTYGIWCDITCLDECYYSCLDVMWCNEVTCDVVYAMSWLDEYQDVW